MSRSSGNEEVAARTSFFQKVEHLLFGYDFFISYSWDDGRKYALALHRALSKPRPGRRPLSVFLDSEEYRSGSDLHLATRWSVARADQLLLVVTPSVFGQKPWVLREVELFMEKKGRYEDIGVIPIRVAKSWLEAPAESPLKARLSNNILYLSDSNPGEPSEETINKIFDSVKKRTRQEFRQRIVLAASVVLGILAVAATVLATLLGNSLERYRLTVSNILFTRAQQEWDKGKPHEALAYLAESIRAYPANGKATRYAGILLARQPLCIPFAPPFQTNPPFKDAAFDRDSLQLATLSSDGTLLDWDFTVSPPVTNGIFQVGTQAAKLYRTPANTFGLTPFSEAVAISSNWLAISVGSRLFRSRINGSDEEFLGSQEDWPSKGAISPDESLLVSWSAKDLDAYDLVTAKPAEPFFISDIRHMAGENTARKRRFGLDEAPFQELGGIAFPGSNRVAAVFNKTLHLWSQSAEEKILTRDFPTKVAFQHASVGYLSDELSTDKAIVNRLFTDPSGAMLCMDADGFGTSMLARYSPEGQLLDGFGPAVWQVASLVNCQSLRYPNQSGIFMTGETRDADDAAIGVNLFSARDFHPTRVPIRATALPQQPMSSDSTLLVTEEADGAFQVWDLLPGFPVPALWSLPRKQISFLLEDGARVACFEHRNSSTNGPEIVLELYQIAGQKSSLVKTDTLDGAAVSGIRQAILSGDQRSLFIWETIKVEPGKGTEKVGSRFVWLDLSTGVAKISGIVEEKIESFCHSQFGGGSVLVLLSKDGGLAHLDFSKHLAVPHFPPQIINEERVWRVSPGFREGNLLVEKGGEIHELSASTLQPTGWVLPGRAGAHFTAHPKAQCLAVATANTLEFIDRDTQNLRQRYSSKGNFTWSVSVSSDGRFFIGIRNPILGFASSGSINVYDSDTGELAGPDFSLFPYDQVATNARFDVPNERLVYLNKNLIVSSYLPTWQGMSKDGAGNVADLLEGLACARLEDGVVVARIATERWGKLERLRSIPKQSTGVSKKPNPADAFLRWYVSDRSSRPGFPAWGVSLEEFADKIVQVDNFNYTWEALLLAPQLPELNAALAVQFSRKAMSATNEPPGINEMRWMLAEHHMLLAGEILTNNYSLNRFHEEFLTLKQKRSIVSE